MFKAIKDNRIVGICETKIKGGGNFDDQIEDIEHSISDYEQYNGEYVLKQYVPVDYRNDLIRQQRQARFAAEADPLRLDWDESAARGEVQAEEKKQIWLAKKDQIREELPYIESEGDHE